MRTIGNVLGFLWKALLITIVALVVTILIVLPYAGAAGIGYFVYQLSHNTLVGVIVCLLVAVFVTVGYTIAVAMYFFKEILKLLKD